MYNDERVKKTMFAEMGKYGLDLSKLVFGGGSDTDGNYGFGCE